MAPALNAINNNRVRSAIVSNKKSLILLAELFLIFCVIIALIVPYARIKTFCKSRELVASGIDKVSTVFDVFKKAFVSVCMSNWFRLQVSQRFHT